MAERQLRAQHRALDVAQGRLVLRPEQPAVVRVRGGVRVHGADVRARAREELLAAGVVVQLGRQRRGAAERLEVRPAIRDPRAPTHPPMLGVPAVFVDEPHCELRVAEVLPVARRAVRVDEGEPPPGVVVEPDLVPGRVRPLVRPVPLHRVVVVGLGDRRE